MEHFSEQTCVDFVRGVSGPKVSNDIRRHLAQDCSICKTDLEAWNLVRGFATDEVAYAPPENLVRMVKLGFTSKAAQQSTTWTLASLVFDSFAQLLMAGVRSGALNFWQVIYEAEGLSVDLHFGYRAQSKAVHLVGQVFDKQAARALQNNASIELSTEQEQLLAATTVSTLGEFYIEYEANDPLWLAIKAAGRNPVRIPLTKPKQR